MASDVQVEPEASRDDDDDAKLSGQAIRGSVTVSPSLFHFTNEKLVESLGLLISDPNTEERSADRSHQSSTATPHRKDFAFLIDEDQMPEFRMRKFSGSNQPAIKQKCTLPAETTPITSASPIVSSVTTDSLPSISEVAPPSDNGLGVRPSASSLISHGSGDSEADAVFLEAAIEPNSSTKTAFSDRSSHHAGNPGVKSLPQPLCSMIDLPELVEDMVNEEVEDAVVVPGPLPHPFGASGRRLADPVEVTFNQLLHENASILDKLMQTVTPSASPTIPAGVSKILSRAVNSEVAVPNLSASGDQVLVLYDGTNHATIQPAEPLITSSKDKTVSCETTD